MKKILFVVVVAILAAVNVALTVNSKESVIDLSLANIMALARGETNYCSICGYDVNTCSCDDYGITCDHAGCWAKVCHKNTHNPICWCEANGNPFSFCI